MMGVEAYVSREPISFIPPSVLPSKLFQTILRLVGNTYAAAGQADGGMHTMAVLQADFCQDKSRDCL